MKTFVLVSVLGFFFSLVPVKGSVTVFFSVPPDSSDSSRYLCVRAISPQNFGIFYLKPGERVEFPDGYNYEFVISGISQYDQPFGADSSAPLYGGLVSVSVDYPADDPVLLASRIDYLPDPKRTSAFNEGFGFGCVLAGAILCLWILQLLRRPVLEA